jgi:alkylation response protein AidB-like acyl-CoA dehydrogenase
VNFALSEEQELLREAARDALARLPTRAAARAALDGGPPPDLWPTACAAGWTGLLVEAGAVEAMLVHQELGRALAGGGLLGHLLATEVLRHDPAQSGLLAELAAGTRRAAIALARPPGGRHPAWTVDAAAQGAGRTAAPIAQVRGERARVRGGVGSLPDVPGAAVGIVVCTGEGSLPLPVLLDPLPAAEPVASYDATRSLGRLQLDAEGVVLATGGVERAWYLGQGLLAAEALGVSEAMLAMSVAYAKERYAFGRPIGSYQAIKHQIVDIQRRIGATTSLLLFAGYAAEHDPGQFALAASSARFAAEDCADYASRTCIAVHGGIGATWEHDAPLYWRRSQLSRLLLGGRADAGDRVAEEIIKAARTAVQQREQRLAA